MKALLLLITSSFFPSHAQETLLAAEQSVKDGAPLSSVAHMRGHPLYPYLEYRTYRDNLTETPVAIISDFLHQHPAAPFSGWLAEQAFPLWLASGEYQAIIHAYDPRLADDSIECEYRLAQLATGNRYAAYQNIQNLWQDGGGLDSACVPLLRHAVGNGLSNDQLRQQFIRAIQNNQITLARQISRIFSGEDAIAAKQWLDALNSPQLTAITAPYWQQNALAYNLSRQAFKNTTRSADIAFSQQRPGTADSLIEADLYNRLTRALEDNDDPRTFQAWQRIPKGKHDNNAISDLIAYSLRRNDWHALAQALDNDLDDSEKSPEVHYWLGKAYEKLNNQSSSHKHYRKAAAKRDFFGFLAAEKLGIAYDFNDHSIIRDSRIEQTLLNEPEAYRMRIFQNIGMDSRALSEWRSLLKNRPTDEVRQAVLMADRYGWHIHAISALAKEKDWDALNVRFPTDYEAQVRALAAKHQLSPATIYAIIRKESIFQPTIKSPAGAIGLMQIMPATARDTARRYEIPYSGTAQLTDINTNLTIGSQYLADRLQEFGHLAYAAAAYNAGPHRARKWLNEYPNLPLDEWIAQIPFTETRDYVKRVLEYEKVYQYRLGLPYVPYSSATVRAW